MAPVFSYFCFNLSLDVSALGGYLSSLYFPGGLQNTISMFAVDVLNTVHVKKQEWSS